MKYRIVSNGEHYKVLYKAYWYSPWRYLKENDMFRFTYLNAQFTSLDKAEAFIKEHIAEVLKARRQYKTVKELDLSKLEIALADEIPK